MVINGDRSQWRRYVSQHRHSYWSVDRETVGLMFMPGATAEYHEFSWTALVIIWQNALME